MYVDTFPESSKIRNIIIQRKKIRKTKRGACINQSGFKRLLSTGRSAQQLRRPSIIQHIYMYGAY